LRDDREKSRAGKDDHPPGLNTDASGGRFGRDDHRLLGIVLDEICAMGEEGTGPHVILPRNKKALFWKGADHPVRMVNHPGTKPRPYLMPAAGMHYPSLALRIRAQMEWGPA